MTKLLRDATNQIQPLAAVDGKGSRAMPDFTLSACLSLDLPPERLFVSTSTLHQHSCRLQVFGPFFTCSTVYTAETVTGACAPDRRLRAGLELSEQEPNCTFGNDFHLQLRVDSRDRDRRLRSRLQLGAVAAVCWDIHAHNAGGRAGHCLWQPLRGHSSSSGVDA